MWPLQGPGTQLPQGFSIRPNGLERIFQAFHKFQLNHDDLTWSNVDLSFDSNFTTTFIEQEVTFTDTGPNPNETHKGIFLTLNLYENRTTSNDDYLSGGVWFSVPERFRYQPIKRPDPDDPANRSKDTTTTNLLDSRVGFFVKGGDAFPGNQFTDPTHGRIGTVRYNGSMVGLHGLERENQPPQFSKVGGDVTLTADFGKRWKTSKWVRIGF